MGSGRGGPSTHGSLEAAEAGLQRLGGPILRGAMEQGAIAVGAAVVMSTIAPHIDPSLTLVSSKVTHYITSADPLILQSFSDLLGEVGLVFVRLQKF